MGRRIKKASRHIAAVGREDLSREERKYNNSSNTISGRTIEVYQLLRNIKEYITNQKKNSTKRTAAAAVRGQHQHISQNTKAEKVYKKCRKGLQARISICPRSLI